MSHESTQERAIALVALYGAEERTKGLLEGVRALDDILAVAKAAAADRHTTKPALVALIETIVSRYRREHGVT